MKLGRTGNAKKPTPTNLAHKKGKLMLSLHAEEELKSRWEQAIETYFDEADEENLSSQDKKKIEKIALDFFPDAILSHFDFQTTNLKEECEKTKKNIQHLEGRVKQAALRINDARQSVPLMVEKKTSQELAWHNDPDAIAKKQKIEFPPDWTTPSSKDWPIKAVESTWQNTREFVGQIEEDLSELLERAQNIQHVVSQHPDYLDD